MSSITLAQTISELQSDEWGPETVTETTLDGVPYAPYSKGDKLGRMADWTTEGKDREGRGGRAAYNRQYRGMTRCLKCFMKARVLIVCQINKSMAQAHPHCLASRSQKTSRHSR